VLHKISGSNHVIFKLAHTPAHTFAPTKLVHHTLAHAAAFAFTLALTAAFLLLRLGVGDGFVDTQDQTLLLTLLGNLVLLDDHRFPDEVLHGVLDLEVQAVHTIPPAVGVLALMLLSQLVQQIGLVPPAVLDQCPGYYFKLFLKLLNHPLLLADDLFLVLLEEPGDLELDLAAAADDLGVLGLGLDDHERVVNRSLLLVDKLLLAPPNDHGLGLALFAVHEEVPPLPTDLPLFEAATASEDGVLETLGYGRLHRLAGGLTGALHILLLDTALAEDTPVLEVLGLEVADLLGGEDDVGASVLDLIELLVDDLPLLVNNALEVLLADPDLLVLPLLFQLELQVQEEDLRVVEGFRLLLEALVGETLLELDTLDEHTVGDTSTDDLLHAHGPVVEALLLAHEVDLPDNHVLKKGLVVLDEFRVQGGFLALFQHLILLLFVLLGEIDLEHLQLLDLKLLLLPVAPDDGVLADTLLEEVLLLFQKLAADDDDGGGAVTHLHILGFLDVGQDSLLGVHDVQLLHNGLTVVRDQLLVLAFGEHELVHTPGA